jgi:hypothetical protein
MDHQCQTSDRSSAVPLLHMLDTETGQRDAPTFAKTALLTTCTFKTSRLLGRRNVYACTY